MLRFWFMKLGCRIYILCFWKIVFIRDCLVWFIFMVWLICWVSRKFWNSGRWCGWKMIILKWWFCWNWVVGCIVCGIKWNSVILFIIMKLLNLCWWGCWGCGFLVGLSLIGCNIIVWLFLCLLILFLKFMKMVYRWCG